MGGYMGFGMASWIYKQRPRKAFSKRKRRPTCNTLPSYDRQFKLQPSKNKREIYIGFSLLLVILITVGLYYKVPEFTDYHQERSVLLQEKEERLGRIAFNLFMKSAAYRSKSNNLEGAYSELKLAQAIYPDNSEVNQLLIETLVSLCEDGNTYCEELEILLQKSL